MTIKEKFLSLVSKEKTNTAKEINYRIKNRNKIKESQDFSIKIFDRLDELNLSVEDFCLEIGLSLLDFNEFCKGELFLDDDIKNKIIDCLKTERI